MAKLTKSQRRSIEEALNATNILIAFLERQDVAICREWELNIKVEQGPDDYRAKNSHRSQHYVGRDNSEWDIDYVKELSPMDKGVGSPLVSRYDIKKNLERLLEE